MNFKLLLSESRNPSVQIRAIRTWIQINPLEHKTLRRNPSVQIRAIRTVLGRGAEGGGAIVAIPQYRSGQFGRLLPVTSSASWSLRSRNPSVQIRAIRTGRLKT